jgi:hypothetical protein
MKRFCSAAVLVFAQGLTAPTFVLAQDAPAPSESSNAADQSVAVAPLPVVSSESVLSSVRERLIAEFDTLLEDPARYERLVAGECRMFPLGQLFPFLYPAMGYVNVALREPERKEHCIEQARKLLDVAIEKAAASVRAPNGRLDELESYRGHAVMLGQLNLALGAYYLIADDNHYDAIHARLSDVLHEALVEANGAPIKSFPYNSWPFDTIPVLLSLKLYDLKTWQDRSGGVINRHLAWVREHATDPALGLPYSRINENTGAGLEAPRGCDLSFRVCLLQELDPVYAKELYTRYVESYWLERGVFAGFAEWPKGSVKFMDMDSGPIIMGIGLGATGLGLGTVIAMDDQARLNRLCIQLSGVEALRSLLIAVENRMPPAARRGTWRIPLDERHVTGFLFGDAMLFYCATWRPWTAPQSQQTP